MCVSAVRMLPCWQNDHAGRQAISFATRKWTMTGSLHLHLHIFLIDAKERDMPNTDTTDPSK